MPAQGKFFGLEFLSPRRWPTCPPEPWQRRDGLLRCGVILIFFLWVVLRSIPCYGNTTATYQINEVKNENGDPLSNVKIYVDGGYVHHYSPETLEFCEGCYCYDKDDEQVSCGFGEHTVTLKKSGYQDWSETRTINPGDEPYEVNPVMNLLIPTSTPTPISTPTQVPTNTPTPTSTPTPLSTKATYKINEVIDEEGDVLSSVKIYVDGVYVHHYAPETLEFCDGCQCDGYVNCGFGEHTIKLEESGYQDWSEVKTISAGDSHEVNPVMSLLSPTSTPTPTPTSTPRLSPTSTPIKTQGISLTPTPFGEVLGATKSGEATFSSYLEEGKDEEKELEEKGGSSPFLWPKVLIGLGLALIIGASYPLWLPKCSALLKICSRRRINGK